MELSTKLEYGECDGPDLDLISDLVAGELNAFGGRWDDETLSEETVLGFVRELDENEPFEWRVEDALGEDYGEYWDFEWLDSIECTETFSDLPDIAHHPIGLPASTVDSLIEAPSPTLMPARFSLDGSQVSPPWR